MHLRVLGPLSAADEDGNEAALGGPKQRLVLATLALAVPAPVSTDRLVDVVWGRGDTPTDPIKTLRVYVANLRALLGRDAVTTRGTSYAIDPTFVSVDLVEFRRLAAAGRDAVAGGRPCAATVALRDALELWTAEPLAGVRLPSELEQAVERLAEERVAAVEDLAEADLALGRHPPDDLARLVDRFPHRERLHRQLALALHRQGRSAEALDVLSTLRRNLRDDLGLTPTTAHTRLEHSILTHDPSLEAGPPVRVALPADFRQLIGRAAEVDRLRDQLTSHRLVVLTGAGGVGKTRIALEAGRDFANAAGLAAVHLDLANVVEGQAVDSALAHVLGARSLPGSSSLEALIGELERRETLIVLDGCERHRAAVADLVERLLTTVPGARVLATSREALGISGERRVPVEPLATPPEGVEEVDIIAEFPAIELLVQRVLEADPGFRLTSENAGALAHIARKVDGFPLAIELVASQADVREVGDIANALDEAGPTRRQVTEAVAGWSRTLLDGDAATLFRRLNCFVGGFTLDAAEVACADEVLDRQRIASALGTLVKTSLVAREGSGSGRFRMLDVVRDLASALAAEQGEASAQRSRHADWAIGLAAACDAAMMGPGQAKAMEVLQADMANLDAALDWCLANDTDRACELAHRLGYFWLEQGHHVEGVTRLREALAVGTDVRPSLRAEVQRRLANLLIDTDPDSAEVLLRESLAVAVTMGDEEAIATRRFLLALVHLARNEVDEGIASLRQACDTFEALGLAAHAETALSNLGRAHMRAKSFDEARLAYERCLVLARANGRATAVAASLANLAGLERKQHGPIRAVPLFQEALDVAREAGLVQVEAMVLANLAVITADQGDVAQAIPMLDRAREIYRALGNRRFEAIIVLEQAGFVEASGQRDRALELFLETLPLVQQAPHDDLVAADLRGIARCLPDTQPTVVRVHLHSAGAALHPPPFGSGEPMLADQGGPPPEWRAELGADAYDAAVADGAALGSEGGLARAFTVLSTLREPRPL